MPAFHARAGMPYWIDLNTPDPRRAAAFYQGLLGWSVAEEQAGSGYLIARKAGLPVAGLLTATDEAATWVTYFLVDHLGDAAHRVVELGGRVLTDPAPAQLGDMQVMADPAGALIGLVEPRGEEAFVAAGEPGCAVWHELSTTSGFDDCVQFYEELFGWQAAVIGGAGTALPAYATLLADSAPFAGLRDAQGQFPPGTPAFWQTFLGVASVDAAATRVAGLGGEVILGPVDAEFGRLLVVADPTGATVTLCEVAEYTAPDPVPGEGQDVFEALRNQGLA